MYALLWVCISGKIRLFTASDMSRWTMVLRFTADANRRGLMARSCRFTRFTSTVCCVFAHATACVYVPASSGRWHARSAALRMCSSDEDEYLARHPYLKADLLAALDHAISNRAEDPRSAIAAWLSPRRAAAIAPSSECPHEGVQFSHQLPERSYAWMLWWNHFCNLDFTNDNFLSELPLEDLSQSSYPVRVAASAGLRREWSLSGGQESTRKS